MSGFAYLGRQLDAMSQEPPSEEVPREARLASLRAGHPHISKPSVAATTGRIPLGIESALPSAVAG